MNFYDLSAKLRAIEESSVAECGDMMPMPMMSHAPQQQDSVTMNVSMNGSGAGGIKDLMSILRNIEQSAEHDHAEPMIAQPHSMDGDVDIVLGTADEDMLSNADADESYGNSAPGGSDAHTYGIDAVTRKGDDMHSKGDVKRLRVNGGENPLQEALVERLSAMYQEIKEAKAIDPVRSADVQQIPQKVKSQANRPGLASDGDPKLWDIQHELQKRGYKIKTDGLNGPGTQKAARSAGMIDAMRQDVANPNAASGGYDIGHTIGSGIGWIETAWRNLKQGFGAGQAGLEESKKKTMSRAAKGYMKYGKKGMKALADAGREGKDLEPIQDKFNKYK
jgi:hypothetical protein